jgi:hypothetical protein
MHRILRVVIDKYKTFPLQDLRECKNRSNQEVFGHFGSIGKEKRRYKQCGKG